MERDFFLCMCTVELQEFSEWDKKRRLPLREKKEEKQTRTRLRKPARTPLETRLALSSVRARRHLPF